MRIAFVNTNVAWGGGERWTHQFSRLARDAGHHVTVLAHTDGELARRLANESSIAVHPIRLGNLSFLNPLTTRKVAKLFRTEQVDTVVMCLPRDLKVAGPAAQKAGVARIVFRRGIDVPVKDTAMNRKLYGKVITRLICNTNATRRSVLTANPNLIPADLIRVVNNGFDVAEFDARPATPMFTKRNGEIVIGCAARLTEQKGIPLLLHAAAILKKRGREFTIALAGSGALELELKAQAQELGLEKQIKFLGFVEDIKSFYASIDILALPSLFEGFGYVLIEAGRCGKPAVAFDVSSNPEVVRDGETGLLAAPGDARDFADKLNTLMKDPALLQRMGQEAREHAVTYDTTITYRQFEDALG